MRTLLNLSKRIFAFLLIGLIFVFFSDFALAIQFKTLFNTGINMRVNMNYELWTPRFSPNVRYRGIAFGNGLFVAVGDNGLIITSPDGINWTQRTSPLNSHFTNIIFGNNIFVISVNDSVNNIMTSPDGINWTVRQILPNAFVNAMTFGNGKFIVAGSNSNFGGNGNYIFSTTTDGVTWTQSVSPANITPRDITFGNGLFVIVGQGQNPNPNTGRILTSPDGITWTSRSLPTNDFTVFPISENISSITYGNNLFVATISSNTIGNSILTSPDGITWTLRKSIVSTWTKIEFFENTFIAIANSGTNQLMISTDGINWIAKNTLNSSLWTGISYGNGKIVAVAAAINIDNLATTSFNKLNNIGITPSFLSLNQSIISFETEFLEVITFKNCISIGCIEELEIEKEKLVSEEIQSEQSNNDSFSDELTNNDIHNENPTDNSNNEESADSLIDENLIDIDEHYRREENLEDDEEIVT